MREIGQYLLKIISVIAVVIGVVAAFIGLYMLMDNTFTNEYTLSSRLANVGSLYTIVFGVVYVLFGFYGAMNSEESEADKTCIKNGCIMVAMCIVNVGLMAYIGNLFAILSLLITMIPLVVALIYILATVFKMKGKQKQ